MKTIRDYIKAVLYSKPGGYALRVGDAVTVDGLRGRGVITKRIGKRLVVSFRNGWKVERDQNAVHKI